MAAGLTSGGEALKEAARRYFSAHYQNPAMKFSTQVDARLGYKPTIQFKIHKHLTVLVEVSETPYPAILTLRRTDIEDLQIPIAVFCVCPEEAYLANQADVKRLIAHGFGLITIAEDGQAHRRANCNPLIQRIADVEFNNELKGLTPVLKRRLVEAFDRYNGNAASGVADVAEVLEGFVLKAGREGVAKGWLPNGSDRAGSPAMTLDAMQIAAQFRNAMAAIGSVRGYISEYRNVSHHFPKNPAQAARKYRECRHAFIDGLKRVGSFRTAMKAAGLSGNLP